MDTARFAWAIAGRFAAFLEIRATESGGLEDSAVVRRDLRTGAQMRDHRPALLPSDPPGNPFANRGDFEATDLVLRSTGALAWIVSDGTNCELAGTTCRVIKLDREGRVLLDEGIGIDTRSLVLNGSTVTWTNAGQQRSASLR